MFTVQFTVGEKPDQQGLIFVWSLNSIAEPYHPSNDKFATIGLSVTTAVPKGEGYDSDKEDNIGARVVN